MKATVLDSFKEGTAVCIVGKTNLNDYLDGLPNDYEDYFIQRGIVTNKYLDQLWDTVSKKNNIPSIVLVSNGHLGKFSNGEEIELHGEFKILDGLQRTKRLKVISDAAAFIDSELDDDEERAPALIGRQHRDKLNKIDCSQKLFIAMLSTARAQDQGENLSDILNKTRIGVEVWYQLETDLQIKKMLILNAGHKSVNIKHQIELLFYSYLAHLESLMPQIEIVRERDVSSISYSKKRTPKQFHFSHLISAFVSLGEGKPVTTNSDFSVGRSFSDSEGDAAYFDGDLLKDFSRAIASLDKEFSDPLGVKWIGREVVLVGLFGAIGRFSEERQSSRHTVLEQFEADLPTFSQAANLSAFEDARNSLELSKVNIGNKNKMAVFEAVTQFLNNPDPSPIDWNHHFKLSEGE